MDDGIRAALQAAIIMSASLRNYASVVFIRGAMPGHRSPLAMGRP